MNDGTTARIGPAARSAETGESSPEDDKLSPWWLRPPADEPGEEAPEREKARRSRAKRSGTGEPAAEPESIADVSAREAAARGKTETDGGEQGRGRSGRRKETGGRAAKGGAERGRKRSRRGDVGKEDRRASSADDLPRVEVRSPPAATDAVTERKIAVFCDLESTALKVQDSELGEFEVRLVLERVLEKGKVVAKKAYADWERCGELKAPFHEAGMELIDIPHGQISDRSCAGVKIAVDAMELCHTKRHVDTFVLVSGDADLSALAAKLRENDRWVIGVGLEFSSSRSLIESCDEFMFYEDVWRDEQAGPSLEGVGGRSAEVFGLMVDAIKALLREDKEILWGSMIKQTMQRKHPSFTEGYYGYSSFSELLEDAERQGVISLQRDSRSGTYVVTGFAGE